MTSSILRNCGQPFSCVDVCRNAPDRYQRRACPAAQVGVELLYNAVQALLYTLIVFYMVGFDMNGSSTGAARQLFL